MDPKPILKNPKSEMPRGVSVRKFKTEERIQVAFSYRGEECRELLPPQKINKTTLQLAAGLRAEIQRSIAEGTFLYSKYFANSDRAAQFADKKLDPVKMSKLLDSQLAMYRHQQSPTGLSKSTVDGYEKAMKSERMSHWRGLTIDKVTPVALRDWIRTFKTTKKTIRNHCTPLRSILEDAVNDDLIVFNPFDKIEMTKLLAQTARDSSYVINPFNAAERAKLIEAARPDEWPMVKFWFESGLRPSELMGLKWSRIDLAGARLHIEIVQVAGVEQEKTKTEAGTRWVDMSPEALDAVEAQKAATLQAGEHVWHNPRKGIPWETADQIRKTLWIPLCARAEIEYRNPYQVRHTFASSRLTAGENPWFIAEQLGHVDVTLVFERYGKFIGDDYIKPTLKPNVTPV